MVLGNNQHRTVLETAEPIRHVLYPPSAAGVWVSFRPLILDSVRFAIATVTFQACHAKSSGCARLSLSALISFREDYCSIDSFILANTEQLFVIEATLCCVNNGPRLTSHFSYVLVAAASTGLVSLYHAYLTGSARKKAGVKYPNAYATAAEAAESKEKQTFNCAQSAHRNFGENQTSFLVTMLISGLNYPMLSAWSGALWVVCRIVYAWGYVASRKPDGKGRLYGLVWEVPHALMLGTAFWTGLSFVKGPLGP